jgi:PGF-CTERM protein
MNMKVVILFFVVLVILRVPASLAKPEYLTNLNQVYGNGSCATCHVNSSSDGPRTLYGTLFENQPNFTTNPSAALRAIGAPPGTNPTLSPTATAATATMTPAPEITTVSATAPVAPTTTVSPTVPSNAPGFGIVLSLIGLFAWAYLARRNNK